MLVRFNGIPHQPGFFKQRVQPLRFRSAEQDGNKENRRMAELAQKYPVLQRMFELIDISSATPQEDPGHHQVVEKNLTRIRTLITRRFREIGITDIEQNEYGALIIRVPGSPGYENARPLLLTAHMDIVPADRQNPTRPVIRTLKTIEGEEFIATDGTTTLGADDKGGIAMIIENVAQLRQKPHVPIEILLSPDEESSCNSLRQMDTSKFRAKEVLVVDEFYDFRVTNGLASSVLIDINVSGTNGGHSGGDINKPNRLNAIMLLNRVLSKLGTGTIAEHPKHPGVPLISKNLGLVHGGSAPNAIPESASATFMLRSFDRKAQEEELARIARILKSFEKHHQRTQPNLKLEMAAQEEYPPWQGHPHSVLPPLCVQASKEIGGPPVRVGPFHVAAQASILANKTNHYGEPFDAVLIGPRIEEAHTVRERIDWKSLVRVNEWLGKIIELYTSRAKQNRL